MKKFFRLPTPKELGISESNALGLRRFTPWEKSVCWEDYDRIVKEKFPVKFFLFKTFPDFVKYNLYFPIARPISDAWYWFKCHTFPSKKYHLLDLRQPCAKDDVHNYDCYRYGWVDVPEKMLYAMFNLLKQYIDEEPFDVSTKYSLEQIEADEGLKRQHNEYQEAKAILHWWQVERKQEINRMSQLSDAWISARQDDTAPNDPETKLRFDEYQAAREAFETKTDEMIARLMKIRRGLWT